MPGIHSGMEPRAWWEERRLGNHLFVPFIWMRYDHGVCIWRRLGYFRQRSRRDHVKSAAAQHGGGHSAGGCACLQMQVAQHCPALPAAKEAGSATVDAAAKECHRTRGAKASRGDIVGVEAKFRAMHPCRGAKGLREIVASEG